MYELNWDDITKKRETVGKKVKASKVVNGDIIRESDELEDDVQHDKTSEKE